MSSFVMRDQFILSVFKLMSSVITKCNIEMLYKKIILLIGTLGLLCNCTWCQVCKQIIHGAKVLLKFTRSVCLLYGVWIHPVIVNKSRYFQVFFFNLDSHEKAMLFAVVSHIGMVNIVLRAIDVGVVKLLVIL